VTAFADTITREVTSWEGVTSRRGPFGTVEFRFGRYLLGALPLSGLVDERTPPDRTPKTLEGVTLVLTGGLDTVSREEATAMATAAGARVASSVSGKTTFVVAGRDPGTKLAKAESLGVEVIDEAEFRKRLGA